MIVSRVLTACLFQKMADKHDYYVNLSESFFSRWGYKRIGGNEEVIEGKKVDLLLKNALTSHHILVHVETAKFTRDSWDKIVEQTEQVYKEVLAEHKKKNENQKIKSKK